MKRKILFICGSVNQTSMMHRISLYFPDYDCYFTPYYYAGDRQDALVRSLFHFSIIGGKYRELTFDYLRANNLPIDDGGNGNDYDVVFTCQDLIIQKNIQHAKIFLVQEGMTDPEKFGYYLVKRMKFPRWIAGTSATGMSKSYQLFFVASEGYRELFIRKGADPRNVVATGIPNFDNAAEYLRNDFPQRSYVLVITSNLRECHEYENRKKFILRAKTIAGNRRLLFKLHPSENETRAVREINRYAPGSLIYSTGNTNHMIANCVVMVTHRSSTVYVAHALGKEIHADIPAEEIARLAPIQNGGRSAWLIASIARQSINRLSPVYARYPWRAASVVHRKKCFAQQPVKMESRSCTA
jgi:hypothetical protein